MTIETKNREEWAKINTPKESDISPKNTEALGKDLNTLLPNDPESFKMLMGKLNYWDEAKAWPTDIIKWTNVEKNVGWILSKADAIDRLLSMNLVGKEDIKSLSPDMLTKKIQQAMYERIQQNPDAKSKLENFLRKKWLPNGWLLDGKFGARSILMMEIIIDIPLTEEPKKELLKQTIEQIDKPDFLNTRNVWRILIPTNLSQWWSYIGVIKDVFLRATWDHPSATVPFYIISIDGDMSHVRWDYDFTKLDSYKKEGSNHFVIQKDLFYKNNLSWDIKMDVLMKLVDENMWNGMVAKIEKSGLEEALYNNELIQSYAINTLKSAYPNAQDIQKTVAWWTSKQKAVAKN